MNSKWEFDVSLINGVMFGLEFPALMEIDEDVKFALALDLIIIRVVLIKWAVA